MDDFLFCLNFTLHEWRRLSLHGPKSQDQDQDWDSRVPRPRPRLVKTGLETSRDQDSSLENSKSAGYACERELDSNLQCVNANCLLPSVTVTRPNAFHVIFYTLYPVPPKTTITADHYYFALRRLQITSNDRRSPYILVVRRPQITVYFPQEHSGSLRTTADQCILDSRRRKDYRIGPTP